MSFLKCWQTSSGFFSSCVGKRPNSLMIGKRQIYQQSSKRDLKVTQTTTSPKVWKCNRGLRSVARSQRQLSESTCWVSRWIKVLSKKQYGFLKRVSNRTSTFENGRWFDTFYWLLLYSQRLNKCTRKGKKQTSKLLTQRDWLNDWWRSMLT